MQVLAQTSAALERLIRLVGSYAAWLSVPLASLIIFDVVSRRFLVLGSTKLQEMEWHLHAALFLLCLGWAYLRNAHVRIDLVRERLGDRTRAAIELIGCVVFLIPYCMIILYFGSEFVLRSWETGEVSSALTGLPYRWAIKSVVVLGFGLLGLTGISVMLNRFVFLFGPDRVRTGQS